MSYAAKFLNNRLERLGELNKASFNLNFDARCRTAQPNPVKSVAREFDPGLLLALGREVDLDLSDVLECFKYGFPIVGGLGAPGLFGDSDAGSAPLVGQVLRNSSSKWEALSSSSKHPFSEEVWRQSMCEVDNGWIEPPMPLSSFDWGRSVPCIRFPLAQGGKVRCCDDLRRSGVNGVAAALSQVCLPSVSSLADLAARVSSNGRDKVVFFQGRPRPRIQATPYEARP